MYLEKKTWQVACTAEEGSHVSAFSFIFLGYLPYLAVVVMVGGLYVLLYQVGLHGNEKVTRCAVGGFHLPHEVLHAKIFTRKRAETVISDHQDKINSFLTKHTCCGCFLPLVRSCSLYIWQMAALWFSNWLTL